LQRQAAGLALRIAIFSFPTWRNSMSLLRKSGIAMVCVCALALGRFAAAEDKKVDLKVGDSAPAFEAKDDQGNSWQSAEHVGKKIVVVYFYPADMTGGCTKQACAFRDDSQKLSDKGVEVVGVSGDSVGNHQVFKKSHNLNFTLLADENGAVAKKFGVPLGKGGTFKTKDGDGNAVELTRGVTIQRWTFVIDKDGKIIHKNTKVNAAKDSQAILGLIEKQGK
jgi:thioredoxin-dependent peroxiredoxin